MKLLLALLTLALPAFPQVYATTVTNGGSGYSGTVTATASGGGCSTEPTFGPVNLNSGAVSSVPITYAGICTLGGTPPTITITGNGSGAAVTAVMLQANIAILSTPLVISDQNPQVIVGGTYQLYRYECTLTVPAARVALYAGSTNVDRMPNTSQTSQLMWSLVTGASALQSLYSAAFVAGIITVYDGSVVVNSGTALATVEATIQPNCAQWQTALNAWNPWSNYGTYYNGTWHSIGIQ